MRFVTRHPIFLVFLAAVAGLTYLVYDTARQQHANTAAAGPPGSGDREETLVGVEPVTLQTMSTHVESIGTAGANESIDITANVSETVTGIHFEDGDYVTKGDLLVELTSASEASSLAEARAAAKDARRQVERLEGLVEKNLVAVTELDMARTALETAEARLEGVMADLEDRVVRAPFSGVLGFRNVSEGSLVSQSTVITTLDDISVIKLDFTVPEVHLAAVSPGDTIEAHSVVYPDREFQGVVRVVGSRIDPVTRAVSVRAHIDNPEGDLRPGMLLTVSLALNSKESLVVPEEAVVLSQGKQFVYTVDEDNIVHRAEVALGRRTPGVVEIESGLLPGQRVVTQGVGRMREGESVRINNAENVPADQLSLQNLPLSAPAS